MKEVFYRLMNYKLFRLTASASNLWHNLWNDKRFDFTTFWFENRRHEETW